MDLRAHLEHLRQLQNAQMAALDADDDLRLEALLDEMAAAVALLPDDALSGEGEGPIADLAAAVRDAQADLIRRAEARRTDVGGALKSLDAGRTALAGYSPTENISLTNYSA